MKITRKIYNYIFILFLAFTLTSSPIGCANYKINEKGINTNLPEENSISVVDEEITIDTEEIHPLNKLSGILIAFIGYDLIGLFDFEKNKLFKIPTSKEAYYCNEYEDYDFKKLISTKNNIIVFSSKIRNQYDIFSLNLENNVIQNLSNDSTSDDINPSLSRNSELILFEKINYGKKTFCVLNAQNKETISIFTSLDSSKNYETCFLPDNKHILFFSGGKSCEAFIMEIESKTQNNLSINNEKILEVKVSPNGKKIALTSKNNTEEEYLSIYDIENNSIKRITKIKTLSEIAGLAWSPDSNQIGWDSIQTGHLPDIFIYNLSTNKIENITNSPDYKDLGVKWSNKNNYFAWHQYNDDMWSEKIVCIYDTIKGRTYKVSNSSLKILNSWYPLWSPDGEYLLFSYFTQEDYSNNIGSIKYDGSNLKQLASLKSSNSEVGDYSWSYDSKYIAYIEQSIKVDSFPELKIINFENGKLEYEYITNGYFFTEIIWLK